MSGKSATLFILMGLFRCLYDWVFAVTRRLYDWVLSWADTKYGTPALFVLSFIESIFFPVPPDVLQVALSASKPKRSFEYAAVNLLGSVSGAVCAFFIGFALWGVVQDFFFGYIPGFNEEVFETVRKLYDDNAFLAIFAGAFTPIPYKVFTITAGVFEISLLILILASLAGRGGRFFAVAAVMYLFGPTVTHWMDKYFNFMTILFTVLVIIGLVAFKYFEHFM